MFRLRLEQEMVIIRYALYCTQLRVVRYLFFARLAGFVFVSLAFFIFLYSTFWGSIHLQFLVSLIMLLAYVFFMLNTVWSKGYDPKKVQRWMYGFVGLAMVQCTLLPALDVLSSSDSGASSEYVQVRTVTQTVTLPGGVVDTQIVGMNLRAVEVLASVSSTDNAQVATSSNAEQAAPSDEVVALAVVGKALNYPNPCRMAVTGTTIGYFLTRDAATEVRVYDPYGNEIYTETHLAGQNGGRGGTGSDNYNRISVTAAKLRTSNVPAGIYFYAILSDGQVLAKGKIAVVP